MCFVGCRQLSPSHPTDLWPNSHQSGSKHQDRVTPILMTHILSIQNNILNCGITIVKCVQEYFFRFTNLQNFKKRVQVRILYGYCVFKLCKIVFTPSSKGMLCWATYISPKNIDFDFIFFHSLRSNLYKWMGWDGSFNDSLQRTSL